MGKETAKIVPRDLDPNNPRCQVTGLRLNLGCGDDIKEGFLNVDPYNSSAQADWDMRKLPLKDNTVAQIICYEALEHIPQADVLPTLQEWYRVLKPRGNAVIIIPDMISACQRFLEDPEDEWALARIYGSQGAGGQFHHAGFTPKSIFKYFGHAGFKVIGVGFFDQDNGVKNLLVEATK